MPRSRLPIKQDLYMLVIETDELIKRYLTYSIKSLVYLPATINPDKIIIIGSGPASLSVCH